MASEVWTFLLSLALLSALGLAQSGGGGGGDDEDAEPDNVCFTELSIKYSSLTCQFDDDLVGTHISLCSDLPFECRNSTLTRPSYTVEIQNIMALHELRIQDKKIDIRIKEMVKLPAPKSITAKYLNNSGVQFGANKYCHDFVKSLQFQVHVWNRTNHQDYVSFYEPFIIEREKLRDLKAGSNYLVKMRVRTGPDPYFKGPWSDWSPTTNFTVDKEIVQYGEDKGDALMYCIISAIIAILVLVICLVTRFRRKALKAFILPNVPHPKTTLVHMQKFNKGLLLSFSPEIFSDIDINRLDEVGEGKPLAPESTDGLEAAGTRSRCPSQFSQVLLWQVPPGNGNDDSDSAGGSQSTLEDEDGELEDHGDGLDTSGTGLRLLGGADPTTSDSGHSSGDLSLTSSVTSTPQRECKDEAYVTMSSLFKTQ